MSSIRTGRIYKAKEQSVRLKSRSALRMLHVMQDRASSEVPKEFLETGRTGRRNAMPHIHNDSQADTSVADLPARLQQLATSDADSTEAGPSGVRKSEDKQEKGSTQSSGASS